MLILVAFIFYSLGAYSSRGDVLKPVKNKDLAQANLLNRNLLEAFSINHAGNFLLIDKASKKLSVYVDFVKINSYQVTIGREAGNKKASGDNRTPEGIFIVKSIDNSSNWVYDYKSDTLGPIPGAYGPWFIRLTVPGFNGIGIHGYYHDNALGERASHGCIRLNNDQLEDIIQFVDPGMPVIILPGENDLSISKTHVWYPK
jgi:lipoprotein-anchoring transpeptidase ErfK/SrfK